MKVVMIIGEPASGKSYIMQQFMKRLGQWRFEGPKFVPHHRNDKRRIIVVGRYDEEHQFPGTDRMSMAAQPHVLEWMDIWQSSGQKAVVFEGDRLGNDSMIASILKAGYDLEVLLITTTLDRRRKSQSDTFLMSRRTKIQNMTGPNSRIAKSGVLFNRVINDNPKGAQSIVDYLISAVRA